MQQTFFETDAESGCIDDPSGLDPVAFFTPADNPTADESANFVDLTDLHEDGLAASVESLNKALILMNYRDRIAARGTIGVMDVTSIESHVPGLLRYHAPKPFTYEASDVNVSYSLEAVDGKIKQFMAEAGKVFNKIIEWIIERLSKLRGWFDKSKYVHKLKYLQTMLRSKVTVLSVAEGRNYLGHAEYDAYWRNAVNVESFNRTFKTDLNVESMTGLHTGASMMDVVKVMSSLKGSAPHDYNDIHAVDTLLMKCFGQTALIAQSIEQAKILYNPALAKAGASYGDETEEPTGEIELPKRVDLSGVAKALQINESHVTKLYQHIGILETNVANLSAKIKELDKYVGDGTPESIAAYKKLRTSLYDRLRNVQTMVQYCGDCLTANYTFISTAVLITGSMMKSSVAKAKGNTNG